MAIGRIEVAHPLDEAEFLEFSPHDFYCSWSDAVSGDYVRPGHKKLAISVFDLKPYSQKCPLVILVAWKENACQIVQSGCLTAQRRADLNLGPCRDRNSPP